MTAVIIGMDPHKRSATIEVMADDEAILGGGRYIGCATLLADPGENASRPDQTVRTRLRRGRPYSRLGPLNSPRDTCHCQNVSS
jgi:hypothetical protein